MHKVSANGAAIPALGFGTFRMNKQDTARMVPFVLNNGYRHIDTAQVYDNEDAVGEGIAASGVKRGDIFLTTKIWVDNLPKNRFAASLDESLKKLKTDYVDLLLLHWPNAAVPLAEQLASLNEAVDAGKVRHIGLSNYTKDLMEKAVALSEAPIVTNQVEYHPYIDQGVVLAAAREHGVSITAYYAMADGKVLDDRTIKAIGERHGKTVPQVVLRWLVQQRGVVALSKTVSEDRAIANAAIFDFELSADEMGALHDLRRPSGRLLSPPGLAPIWDAA